MSTTILKLIPANSRFVPEAQVQEEVLRTLVSIMAPSNMVRLVVSDDVQFIDQGQNWEHVCCPMCGQQIDEWWTQAMDIAQAANFQNLEVQMPCCRKACSLNDLKYEGPTGFARFVIEVENPANSLTAEQKQLVENKLGCELRVIWAHY